MLEGQYNETPSAVRHTCLALLSTCGQGVQFYCPSRTYPAIPYCTIFFVFSTPWPGFLKVIRNKKKSSFDFTKKIPKYYVIFPPCLPLKVSKKKHKNKNRFLIFYNDTAQFYNLFLQEQEDIYYSKPAEIVLVIG